MHCMHSVSIRMLKRSHSSRAARQRSAVATQLMRHAQRELERVRASAHAPRACPQHRRERSGAAALSSVARRRSNAAALCGRSAHVARSRRSGIGKQAAATRSMPADATTRCKLDAGASSSLRLLLLRCGAYFVSSPLLPSRLVRCSPSSQLSPLLRPSSA